QLMEELKRDGGFTVSQGALETLRGLYQSGRVSEEETADSIRATWRATGELVCPHTAVGIRVAENARDTTVPMVTLATAHPAKFPDAVEKATGQRPPLPERMADLFTRPERVTSVPNDLAALEAVVRERRRN
ncbi:MAG: threonine synthase, partial [Albidovulum sp.]